MDLSFQYHDKTVRRRHGLPWDTWELADLKRLYHEEASLSKMCVVLERPANGVVPKLIQLGLIDREGNDIQDIINTKNTMNPTPVVPTITTQTKTLINGTDAATLTDSFIFDLISQKEQQMAKLSSINNKPEKLNKLLNDIQAEINDLVKYVDNR